MILQVVPSKKRILKNCRSLKKRCLLKHSVRCRFCHCVCAFFPDVFSRTLGQLRIIWWFWGPVVWMPLKIPLWKGFLLRGTPRIPNHFGGMNSNIPEPHVQRIPLGLIFAISEINDDETMIGQFQHNSLLLCWQCLMIVLRFFRWQLGLISARPCDQKDQRSSECLSQNAPKTNSYWDVHRT